MTKKILVHGKMLYVCERCLHKRFIFLERGLEDEIFDKEHPGYHKPVPFVIGCVACKKGMMVDRSGLMPLEGTKRYRELPDGEWYFANVKRNDCGVLKRYTKENGAGGWSRRK